MTKFQKIVESAKAAVSAAFVFFGIWGVTAPVTEDQVLQLIALLAAIIGGLVGGSAISRFRAGKNGSF